MTQSSTSRLVYNGEYNQHDTITNIQRIDLPEVGTQSFTVERPRHQTTDDRASYR